MSIDTTGKWWKGSNFDDLAEYIRLLMAKSYPVEEVRQSICQCGNSTFILKADRDEGGAQRICTACHQAVFIGDSKEIWAEVHPKVVKCPCKNTLYEIGVGFSFRPNKSDIRWITIGNRCIVCGVLGSGADWKIDSSPSLYLVDQV